MMLEFLYGALMGAGVVMLIVWMTHVQVMRSIRNFEEKQPKA